MNRLFNLSIYLLPEEPRVSKWKGSPFLLLLYLWSLTRGFGPSGSLTRGSSLIAHAPGSQIAAPISAKGRKKFNLQAHYVSGSQSVACSTERFGLSYLG